MAANALSSKNGSVSSLVTTFIIRGHRGSVSLFLKYDKGNGTSVAVSPVTFVIPELGAAVVYSLPASVASAATLAAYTLTLSATGNYVIPISNVPLEATSMNVTVAFTGGDTQTIQVDAKPDIK